MARLLALSLAAERLDLCEETVIKLIKSGELRAHRIRHQWKISERDLQAFLDRTANRSPRDSEAA